MQPNEVIDGNLQWGGRHLSLFYAPAHVAMLVLQECSHSCPIEVAVIFACAIIDSPHHQNQSPSPGTVELTS